MHKIQHKQYPKTSPLKKYSIHMKRSNLIRLKHASMVHEIQPIPLQKTGYLGQQYFKIKFIFPIKLLIRVRDNLQRTLTAVGFIRLVLTVWFSVTPPFLHDTFSIWHTCVLVCGTTVYIFKMSPYIYDIHFPMHLFMC